MTKTYIMGIYKTTIVFKVLKEDQLRTRVVHTRANSPVTAEAMAIGKIMTDWAEEHFIKLKAVNTEEVEKPC